VAGIFWFRTIGPDVGGELPPFQALPGSRPPFGQSPLRKGCAMAGLVRPCVVEVGRYPHGIVVQTGTRIKSCIPNGKRAECIDRLAGEVGDEVRKVREQLRAAEEQRARVRKQQPPSPKYQWRMGEACLPYRYVLTAGSAALLIGIGLLLGPSLFRK
jgi:hypothetical protein